MLEGLSKALKKTTDKIANAIFLDKNLVDSIVKDLQRALIEADVNVQLVLDLTKEIKQSALDERIKGIEKKEHIIKLMHDKLLSILGTSKQIQLGKENRFMFLGLYGSGKCVHGESKIQLASGEIIKARNLYNRYSSKFPSERLEDGEIINVEKENLIVPSFNPITAKIENKRATHLWKLSKKDLIQIKLDNGNDYRIKVTPEHPFFALRNGIIIKTRADEIKQSDFIAIPREIKIEGKLQSLSEKIIKLPLYIYINEIEAKEIIKQKGKTLRQICKELKYKRNYCRLSADIKRGKIPLELIDEKEYNVIPVKGYNEQKVINIPLFLTADFAEFLGYVMGDGNIRESYVQISNEDPEAIKRIAELSKILFNITPQIKRATRTKKMYDIRMCSRTLVEILGIFNLKPGRKGKELRIPQEILLSPDEVVRSFIRAYFDCDSSPSYDKRCIELTSESHPLIKQMSLLLLRFGIISAISEKIVNNIPYWRLLVKARYAELYASKIGYVIKRKQDRANNYTIMGNIQGCGNQDMIPLGKALRELRERLGFSIGEIQKNAVYSYGRYEDSGFISREKLQKLVKYYKLKKKGIFANLLEDIKNNALTKEKYSKSFINGAFWYLREENLINEENNLLVLSEKGQARLQTIKEPTEELLSSFETLSESNICWLPIREIEEIANDEEFVYDLTVEENHSFIAEGFIVHNTTTISKIASYYSKRGHRVCAIGLDVHRPAAPEQLKQACDKVNVPTFILPGEKDPKKIWKKFESELKNYEIILIDTAGRDALSDDLIKEIKDISKLTKPTESFLVMSADIGQTAKKQAQAFKDACNITGVIITKMDSTAKAGGALTACSEVKAPVVFIGVGEKPSDLESFSPESFLSRLLGMGDLQSLMEKIHSVMDKKQIEEQQKKLQEGKFTLRDLQTQLESMESFSFDKMIDMIPGLGKAKDKIPEGTLETQQEKVKKWKHAINSMTKEEIENPDLLEKQTSRMQRIAKGSGTSVSEIRALIKQYKLLNEMIKSQSQISEKGLDQKTMMKLAKKFGKKMRF